MVGVGQRIGNYRVLRKLGQGGMGAVYEAVQEEIGRRAAIKVLLPDFAKDQQSILRFFNEARAVNIIHHPGLVGVFESGRLDDGAAYIVMEYLSGELLTARLEKAGRLAHQDAINIARQIASALRAAHEKGIVHRDLKPDNVMLIADPEMPDGERVKIFDFGIAKLRLNSLAPMPASKLRTQTGVVMGTPTHMAPGQCRGAAAVDGKADVYSLGVILYQMLVGHPPFMADSPSELMSMHMRDKPPALLKLDPSIPEELADLVHSMLAKEPETRPDMDRIVTELEAMGAYRTRRVNPLRANAAAASAERPKTKISPSPTQRAMGTTINGLTGRRFLIAISIAMVLVAVSAVLLFSEAGGPPPSASRETVVWEVDSDPPGAAVVRADSNEVLGLTPWRRSEPRAAGSLRVNLRLAGYQDTTVILNGSQSTRQKIPLAPKTVDEAKAAPAGSDSAGTGTASSRQGLPAVTGRVRLTLSSDPRGAEVFREGGAQSIGKTPLKLDEELRGAPLKLYLRLEGYQEASVLLDPSSGARQSVSLQKIRGRSRKKQPEATDSAKAPSDSPPATP
ncbi:MAG: serine/threonine protein kinase [Elusimicrobia bacterium]|nr:MAG: serine/threonine protein kinase [Elusimicrobiota bacterium]